MRIYGKTLDVNGVPLSRTTIKKITGVSANKVGTFSDDNGNFDFQSETISPNDEFQISYIGFKPQRFNASELTNKTIKMEESVMELEPVSVVGVVKKKNQEQLTNNFKLHFQKHKMLYAGIGGLLGLALIFTSIKKR